MYNKMLINKRTKIVERVLRGKINKGRVEIIIIVIIADYYLFKYFRNLMYSGVG
jgi:hypothetical protein